MDHIDAGTLIGEAQLFDFAASTAKLIPATLQCTGKPIIKTLRRSYLEIRRTHAIIQRRYGQSSSPPAACEWLLDNWYMVQREYQSVLGELYRASHLRAGSSGALILELCRALLSSGRGEVTEKRCLTFLDGFQSVTVLRRSELQIFPSVLRVAVLGAMAGACRDLRSAADTELFSAPLATLFGSLRLLSVLDMEQLLNSADITGAILSADPTGDYPHMDSDSKNDYLRRVEQLARRSGIEEHIYARSVIRRAKAEKCHVGLLLFPVRKHRGEGLYIGAIFLFTLFLSLLPAFYFRSIAAALLLLIPISELVKNLMDFILLRNLPPVRLPRMDTENGVGKEGRTLCVISTLLDGSDPGRRLEELYFACRSEGKALSFGLLADLPVASQAVLPEDEKALEPARNAIERLNRKYGGGFYLFTRERSFDGVAYAGYERKRGALLELAKLLCGEESALNVIGDIHALKGCRFILTVDGDTRVYPGSVGELIGAMLHPLNAPHIDKDLRIVTEGYGILHPRIDTDLDSANATDFALIFAGAGGCDPYGSLCGELYMNAFRSGGFTGKGLIDVRALLTCCKDRLPEGRVLSHDALEGAFLRGGYMGDVEFSDAFPAHPLNYYKRLQRWIRGDWQNSPWIFTMGLRDIDRWRLLDSLRRSLVAPATLVAIVMGFSLPVQGLSLAAWAALLSLLSRLILSLAEGGLAPRRGIRQRRFTRILTGAGGAIIHCFIRLWLLPYDAFVSVLAIGTALWRMLVSGKNLLQWQTAAQCESTETGALEYIKNMWFSLLLGGLLLWLSPTIIGKSAGLMWMLSPIAASALALPAYSTELLSHGDRQYLTAAAADSWRYLAEFSTAADNYLPPDNFQEQPPVGIAHRSSPTNIGLALACAVAVSRIGVLTGSEALEYVERVISSLARMERSMGHFYNWYDTRTLRPLSPAYISTVDSGNLCAGLLTAGAAARLWGHSELAERIFALIRDMDFAPLYDRKRGLFHICYDVEGKRAAGGWYDLLASEAMLTSYITVAKGDVPKKHWRRLSRAQLQQDGYRGLASWTGSMFEYMMPELFLPLFHGSLLYESGRFCLRVQRRRAFPGKPWGLSESAFYSLDASLSYRYKAHGCPALALRRGLDDDMVISPYSSFLALPVEPRNAVTNLRRLERLGAVGRYGFIEALDFSPGRCRSSDGEPVRCYMAHHVGMSIIAAVNAVTGGDVRKLFMSNPDMSAHQLLLEEKLPMDGVVIRRELTEPVEKPMRSLSDYWRISGGKEDIQEKCCQLSNGAYSVTVFSSGKTISVYGDLLIYEAGHSVVLGLETQSSVGDIFPAKDMESWELSEEQCRFRVSVGETDCSMRLLVAGGDCGELRCVELTGSGEVAVKLGFIPVLALRDDYYGHPAYWALGMHASTEDGSLLIHRLSRDDKRELWLSLRCDREAVFSADKSGDIGWLSRPYVSAAIRLSLDSKRPETIRFALCVAGSREQALAGSERILAASGGLCGKIPGSAAMHLGMSSSDVGAAMALLPQLTGNTLREAAPRQDLWQYGLSCRLPIICCYGDAPESIPVLKAFCLLRSCGIEAELVYLTDEQGEYLRPVYRRICSELSKYSLEALISSPGGVFFAPAQAADVIKSRCAVLIGEGKSHRPALLRSLLSAPRAAMGLAKYHSGGRVFIFDVLNTLPQRAWQLILSNGSFGYIATDCGIGGMFVQNAREMRINLPADNVGSVTGSEALWLRHGEKLISLFAANDSLPCRVIFAPGWACWAKQLDNITVKTTVFIPMDCDARLVIIEGAECMELNWRLETVMGGTDGSSVRCRGESGLFICDNPESYLPDIVFRATASVPVSLSVDYQQPGMLMTMNAGEKVVLACGCCDKSKLIELCKPFEAEARLNDTKNYWSKLLYRLQISMGMPALDEYINHWCLYQCIACRLMGRSSLYQSGGAYGFRDQLQDAVNLLLLSPGYARVRIVDSCRHQYLEGDVMHWWHTHPEGDRGVRTRCSDDLLWLVWALCEYCDATDDYELCGKKVAFIRSEPLSEIEKDRYETPEVTADVESVFHHARLALERSISRGFGSHGLPYFGSGDWNDALNAIDGESVWLGWFMSSCLLRFSLLLNRLGEKGGERYMKLAESIGKAADSAWSGEHYYRGYYSHGGVVGGDSRLDALVQSWAVFSPFADKSRARAAVNKALSLLVDKKERLVRLFDPPFSQDEPSPGYISGYGEGFRENGGQYTHGAIWLAIAAAQLGRRQEAAEILDLLLPEGHDMARYGGEPFVLAADVYSAQGHQGEAGWTWYTGSAGWFFRAVCDELLGLRRVKNEIILTPLADGLSSYSFKWIDDGDQEKAVTVSEGEIYVDGNKYEGGPV